MVHQISILIRQNVGIRNKVVMLPSEFLLHLDIVEAKSIFSGYFVRVGEVVDPLILVETLVEVSLACAARPQEVPLV